MQVQCVLTCTENTFWKVNTSLFNMAIMSFIFFLLFISVGRRGPAKVIEIFVSGSSIDRGGLLFQTHQGVFMRRDGGVQELKARDIQEWIRRVVVFISYASTY